MHKQQGPGNVDLTTSAIWQLASLTNAKPNYAQHNKTIKYQATKTNTHRPDAVLDQTRHIHSKCLWEVAYLWPPVCLEWSPLLFVKWYGHYDISRASVLFIATVNVIRRESGQRVRSVRHKHRPCRRHITAVPNVNLALVSLHQVSHISQQRRCFYPHPPRTESHVSHFYRHVPS